MEICDIDLSTGLIKVSGESSTLRLAFSKAIENSGLRFNSYGDAMLGNTRKYNLERYSIDELLLVALYREWIIASTDNYGASEATTRLYVAKSVNKGDLNSEIQTKSIEGKHIHYWWHRIQDPNGDGVWNGVSMRAEQVNQSTYHDFHADYELVGEVLSRDCVYWNIKNERCHRYLILNQDIF